MSAFSKAITVVTLPLRAAWTAFLIVNFLVVAAAILLVGAFVVYWLALAFSYLFLPEVWTEAIWSWASGLYTEHTWFKVATIAAFVLLLLPVLGYWPGRDPLEEAAHERKMVELNKNLIAVQQQERFR
ncbi:hypothetical protein [Ensifer sp. LCM 4579]|uniref:hypothetical protein n=1 Tax=Ensifer sp. LCM 4579 TaxID=1848292 RepID=UPI0008DA1708|nr:hypothetical protein [Ensifer sp. LCM 4579]OHV80286.1 hypothetical protein LCM4579_22090 [Ensifer sp. LCM 4579]